MNEQVLDCCRKLVEPGNTGRFFLEKVGKQADEGTRKKLVCVSCNSVAFWSVAFCGAQRYKQNTQ